MKITMRSVEKINNLITGYPPETGGILGSSDGVVIDEIVMDVNESLEDEMCSYSPNVEFLNKKIADWQKRKILFMGVFHTHFFGVKTLSCGDKKYIKAIMDAMPQSIGCLYFPIFVLPDRKLVCYMAQKNGSFVDIVCNPLFIK